MCGVSVVEARERRGGDGMSNLLGAKSRSDREEAVWLGEGLDWSGMME